MPVNTVKEGVIHIKHLGVNVDRCRLVDDIGCELSANGLQLGELAVEVTHGPLDLRGKAKGGLFLAFPGE